MISVPRWLLDGACALALTAAGAQAGEIKVSSSADLADALKSASAGDEVILSDGAYKGSFTIEQGVVVKAEKLLGAKIQGTLKLTGDGASVEGLVAEAPNDFAVHVVGKNNKVVRSSFPGSRGVKVEGKASDFYVGYNEFTGETSGGEARQDGVFVDVNGDEKPSGTIERNYFERKNASEDTESHAIYVGPSDNPSVPTLPINIQHNKLGDDGAPYAGRRGIYVKRGVVISNNDAVMSRGEFGARHGEGGRIVANRLKGMRGVSVNGSGHVIADNELIDTELWLSGEGRSNTGNRYQAAHNAVIDGNSGPVIVGVLPNGRRGNGPKNVKITDHTGPIEGDTDSVTIGSGAKTGRLKATKLARTDVGPMASGTAASGSSGASGSVGATIFRVIPTNLVPKSLAADLKEITTADGAAAKSRPLKLRAPAPQAGGIMPDLPPAPSMADAGDLVVPLGGGGGKMPKLPTLRQDGGKKTAPTKIATTMKVGSQQGAPASSAWMDDVANMVNFAAPTP